MENGGAASPPCPRPGGLLTGAPSPSAAVSPRLRDGVPCGGPVVRWLGGGLDPKDRRRVLNILMSGAETERPR
jgi:hypothetical protein